MSKLYHYIVLAMISLFVPSGVQAQNPVSTTIPIETFFKHAEFSQVTLSPDGKTLAALAPNKNRQILVTLDIATRKGARVASFTDQDVIRFWWINNERLVFTLADRLEPAANQRGGGLYAVNKDGTEGKVLSPTVGAAVGGGSAVYRGSSFFQRIRSGGDDLLVTANDRDANYPDLYRLNSKTGRKELLTFDSPGQVMSWVVDRNYVPRVAVNRDKEKISIYYRSSAQAPWVKLEEYIGSEDPPFAPLAFDFDDKTLFVASRRGQDKFAVYSYDPDKKEFKESLFAHPDVDVSSAPLVSLKERKIVGINYNADKPGVQWFDPEREKLQKLVNASLPKTVNFLQIPEGESRILVTAASDVQPAEYFLLDPEKKTMEAILQSREWIKPAQMSEMKPVKFTARDGLVIPAYLTLPKGHPEKNLPLIVYPHGGPAARDTWGFDPMVQFFASRGYAVLQPNFRASTGYGKKLLDAGNKQWGLAMQDDVADAVLWAIKEGIADKNRVCIAGASYGGYAALMGPIKHPELYKCAFNYVGVSDLLLLYGERNTIFDEHFSQSYLRRRLGDPEKDRAYLEANSPIKNAEKINVPLFMAYGGEDRQVTIVHGDRIRAALDRAGKTYQWMFKADEGHGYRVFENQVELAQKLEKFFAEHIGPKK